MTIKLTSLFLLAFISLGRAQFVTSSERIDGSKILLSLTNEKVECTVAIDTLFRWDKLTSSKEWTAKYKSSPSTIETDADFGLEIMWTDWQAPKTINNAENPVTFTRSDFRVQSHSFEDVAGGGKELNVVLQG